MSSQVLQVTIVSAVSWVLWKYFRQFFLSSPLDNIPGPPSRSWLYGVSDILRVVQGAGSCLTYLLGNLKQILAKDGWDFIQHLTDDYTAGIVKLDGLLGVRGSALSLFI